MPVAAAAHALELAPDNQRVSWQNPQTGVAYVMTPLGRRERSGATCREYQLRVTATGRTDSTKGVACRRNDDTWEFVRKGREAVAPVSAGTICLDTANNVSAHALVPPNGERAQAHFAQLTNRYPLRVRLWNAKGIAQGPEAALPW